MKTVETQVKALLRKSYLIQKRKPGKLFLEALFPVISVLILMFYDKESTKTGSIMLPVVLSLAFANHFRSVIAEVLVEKSEKRKEYLKINNMQQSSYVITQLLISYVKCLIIIMILWVGLSYANIKGIGSSQVSSIMWILVSFSLAMTHFSLYFTTLFSSHEIGSSIALLLYLITPLIIIPVLDTDEPVFINVVALLPPVSAMFSLIPVTTDNQIGFPFYEDNVRILFFAGLMYIGLYVYLDQVFPGNHGINRGLFFCLKKRRYDYYENDLNPLVESERDEDETIPDKDGDQNDNDELESSKIFTSADSASIIMNIKKLKKKFGNIAVVDDFTVKIEDKQIVCLLGQNGTGKTTVLNLLTGMTDCDSGLIFYQNLELRESLQEIRKNIGCCTQADILYEDLTILEHLELMASMRVIRNERYYEQINFVKEKCNITEDNDSIVKTLSLGSKRKLSVALSILGNPKLIFLDEPTAGLDHESRISICQTLKELRAEGHTIIMATQFLDEADDLADKIIVLSKGKVFAMGHPEFIKRRFSAGYHLLISPKYQGPESHDHFLELKDFFVKMVFASMPNVKRLDLNSDSFLRFVLPFNERPNFINLFELLEKYPSINLALEMLSLEDAIMNLNEEEEKIQGKETVTVNLENAPIPSTLNISTSNKLNYQLKAMFLRKFFYTRRMRLDAVLALIPSLIIFLTLAVIDFSSGTLVKDDWKIYIVTLFSSISAIPFARFVVYERERNIRYLLNAMGCERGAYWLGTAMFDIMLSFTNTLILLILSSAWDFDIYPHSSSTFLLTALSFSTSLVSSSYLTSFLFKSTLNLHHLFLPLLLFYFLPSLLLYLLTPSSPFSQPSPLQPSSYLLTLLSPLLGLQTILSLSTPSNPPSSTPLLSLSLLLLLHTLLSLLLTLLLEDLRYHKTPLFLRLSQKLLTLKSLFKKTPIPIITSNRKKPSKTPSNPSHNPSNPSNPSSPHNTLFHHRSSSRSNPSNRYNDPSNNPFNTYNNQSNPTTPSNHPFNTNNSQSNNPFNTYNTQSDPSTPSNNPLNPLNPPKLSFSLSFSSRRDLSSPTTPTPHLVLDEKDVLDETRRATYAGNDDPIKLLNLTKHYGSNPPVLKDLSLTACHREIFCLIGPSGAGKSTLLNIATTLIPVDSGTITLQGQRITHKSSEVFHSVGVCMQGDCLWDGLTVREHLRVFGVMKGYNKWDLEANVGYLLEMLKLGKNEGKRAENLSQGTRRKLSVLNALIGGPKMIFLDEPSNGLDVGSKRNFWNLMNKNLLVSNASVVLTTQSMNEAESLSHRIGMMINGKFVCIGPTQYLELKYGTGYRITVKKAENYRESDIYSFFYQATKVIEPHKGLDTFQVSSLNFSFAEAFRYLETLRDTHVIEDFSIYVTRLSQVYTHFAKFQKESRNVSTPM